jgi:hypothetical protein
MFALTGYCNKYRVRGSFATTKQAQNYLDQVMSKEEKKYLTVKIVNSKQLERMNKNNQVMGV